MKLFILIQKEANAGTELNSECILLFLFDGKIYLILFGVVVNIFIHLPVTLFTLAKCQIHIEGLYVHFSCDVLNHS